MIAATTGWAGEFAVFASGSRLHVDGHQVTGSQVRLYSGAGYTELDRSAIVGFEPDGVAAPLPALQGEPQKTDPVASTAPRQLADAAADKYGLPRQLVRSVMAAESGFDPRALSPKGAVGLMQLMPVTAQNLGVDPSDPAQNVDAGARYLRDLLRQVRRTTLARAGGIQRRPRGPGEIS